MEHGHYESNHYNKIFSDDKIETVEYKFNAHVE